MKSSRAFTLIELLIVIAILGILMALLFPAVDGAMQSARKAQAKNDVVQIATAITAYETEYGILPYTNSGPTDVGGDLLNKLIGTNARQIIFLEVGPAKKNKSGMTNGNFVDPWGNKYQAVMDYDNRVDVTAGKETGSGSESINGLMKRAAVFNFASSTANKSDSTYFRKAVRSW